jgi:hypothetical protein
MVNSVISLIVFEILPSALIGIDGGGKVLDFFVLRLDALHELEKLIFGSSVEEKECKVKFTFENTGFISRAFPL